MTSSPESPSLKLGSNRAGSIVVVVVDDVVVVHEIVVEVVEDVDVVVETDAVVEVLVVATLVVGVAARVPDGAGSVVAASVAVGRASSEDDPRATAVIPTVKARAATTAAPITT